PPVLVDEWQRYPESWDRVRRAVDEGAPPGSYLLTGSATTTAATHSGAGRIVRLRMRPLSLAERRIAEPTVSLGRMLAGTRPVVEGQTSLTVADYVDEIVGSGFPGTRAMSWRSREAVLDSYLDRIVEHDFPELDRVVRHPTRLRQWMTAYAAASSTAASYESIRDAATGGHGDKPAKSTTQPYREILERLWVVEPVPAWLPSRNHFRRLTAAPKHRLCDPALSARLLGVDREALLDLSPVVTPRARDTTLSGQLFESLVWLSVASYAQAARARVRHLRTRAGEREIDLVVERADQRVVAIKVKLSTTVDDADVRHLRWLQDQLGPDLLDAVVVTTGADAYRRRDGIAVVPAALLGP
ncbi:MAG: ATP-binding protein, partial [Nocardioidaceae bacterium]